MNKRVSCDKTVNKLGRELIELCKTYGLYILYGRIEPDRDFGNYTYICTNGCSVIHYFLCTEAIIHQVKRFCVEERTESCHFPILTTINWQNDNSTNNELPTETTNVLRYRITDYQKQLHIGKLSDLLTNSVHLELCNSIDNLNTSINEVIGLFIAVLKESAEAIRKKPKRNL